MTEVRGGVREVSRREQQKNVEALDKNFNWQKWSPIVNLDMKQAQKL